MRTEDHLHVEEELRTLRKMLKQYNSYPSRHSFERATVAGRILFQHYGDVLSGENNTVVLPPKPDGRPAGIGLKINFPNQIFGYAINPTPSKFAVRHF